MIHVNAISEAQITLFNFIKILLTDHIDLTNRALSLKSKVSGGHWVESRYRGLAGENILKQRPS